MLVIFNNLLRIIFLNTAAQPKPFQLGQNYDNKKGIGEFWLVVELHRGGPATKRATPCSSDNCIVDNFNDSDEDEDYYDDGNNDENDDGNYTIDTDDNGHDVFITEIFPPVAATQAWAWVWV